jgi:hypothetical protein
LKSVQRVSEIAKMKMDEVYSQENIRTLAGWTEESFPSLLLHRRKSGWHHELVLHGQQVAGASPRWPHARPAGRGPDLFPLVEAGVGPDMNKAVHFVSSVPGVYREGSLVSRGSARKSKIPCISTSSNDIFF